MRCTQLGDYVDIKANPAQQKGMPFRHYHGRTGRVWNVSPRALGVEVNKLVGNRVLKKRIYVRLEHVQPSRCREDFEQRKRTNDRFRAEAKQRGEKPPLLKRQPEQPKSGELVTNVSAETITPVPFDIIREGIKNK
jgi:large subunit ribosomal protein L21e